MHGSMEKHSTCDLGQDTSDCQCQRYDLTNVESGVKLYNFIYLVIPRMYGSSGMFGTVVNSLSFLLKYLID